MFGSPLLMLNQGAFMEDHAFEGLLMELGIYWPSSKKLPTINELRAMGLAKAQYLLDKTRLDSERSQSLVHDPKQRQERSEERQKQVLDYLRSEPYTSLNILSDVLGVTVAGARKIVMRMVDDGLVIRDEISWMGKRKMQIFGISVTGLYDLLDADAPEPDSNHCFHRGKYRITYLQHTLIGQRVRLKLSEQPGGPWVGERHLPGFFLKRGHPDRWKEYPDAILHNSPWKFKGQSRPVNAAIEIEREPKSRPRYRNIISAHLDNIDAERYDIVVYYVKNQRAVERTKRAFANILKTNKGLKIYSGFHASDKSPTAHFIVRSYEELLSPTETA